MGLATNVATNLPLAEGQKIEIERLRLVSELYKLYSPEWDLALSAFEGGPDFATEKNIFKHVRENLEDYKDRVARVHYTNYCEPLVSFFTNFIFSETIDRNGGTNTDWYDRFIRNVNLKGDTIDDFMRLVSDDIQIFGMTYILVDAPSLPPGVLAEEISQANEQELNIRPYWVLLKPNEITDWVVDDFDNFEYLKRMQILNKVLGAGEIVRIERYTEWYRDQIVISEIDITDPSKPRLLPKNIFPNTVGAIPIEVGRYKRSKRYPYMGNAFLRDFAYNNREVMNQTSLIQEFLYRQCFNVLAVEAESNIPLLEQEDGVVGNANTLSYPKGANAPQYITPPADPAKFIQSERQMIVNEMFKRAAQDTLNELFNGEKSSGFSQAQSFSKTVPFISSRADVLERIETRLMQLTTDRISVKWDGKIKYKDRYELTNITDAITQLMMLARDLMLPSKTFVVEELKRLVHEYDGKLSPEVMAKIEADIDAIKFDAWQETQKEALVGKTNSPTEQQKPKGQATSAAAAKESNNQPNTKATKKLK